MWSKYNMKAKPRTEKTVVKDANLDVLSITRINMVGNVCERLLQHRQCSYLLCHWRMTRSAYFNSSAWFLGYLVLAVSSGCNSICFLTSQSKWVFSSCLGGSLGVRISWSSTSIKLCVSDCSRHMFSGIIFAVYPLFFFFRKCCKSILCVYIYIYICICYVCTSCTLIYINKVNIICIKNYLTMKSNNCPTFGLCKLEHKLQRRLRKDLDNDLMVTLWLNGRFSCRSSFCLVLGQW